MHLLGIYLVYKKLNDITVVSRGVYKYGENSLAEYWVLKF